MDLFLLAGGACILCFALGLFIGSATKRAPMPPDIQKDWFEIHQWPDRLKEAFENAAAKEMTEPIPPAVPDWQAQFNAAALKEKHDQLSERAKTMPRDATTGRFQKRVIQDSSMPNSLD